jgi:hypothetical protein
VSDEQQPAQSSNRPAPSSSSQDPFRIVPALNGILWIKRAITLFRIAPAVWLSCSMIMIFTYLLLLALVLIVPIFLPLLFIASAIFTGGLMLGCHQLHQHQQFSVGSLLSGYRSHASSLVVTGLFYFFGTLLSCVLALSVAQSLGYEVDIANINAIATNEVEAQKFVESLKIPMLLMMLFLVPVFMAFWFSPALVVFFNETPLRAFKKSLLACASNLVPFLVFGLCAIVALGILSALLNIIATAIPALGIMLNFAFQLLFTSLSIASIYAAFDDIFPTLAKRALSSGEEDTDHLVA